MADRAEERDGEASGGLSRRHALALSGAAAGGIALAATLTDAANAAGPAAISLELANRVIRAGVQYVQQHPGTPPMYLVVVDESGQEVAAARMDNNSRASLTLVPIKARTAAAFRTATADLAARTTDAARIASFTTAGFSLLAGGGRSPSRALWSAHSGWVVARPSRTTRSPRPHFVWFKQG